MASKPDPLAEIEADWLLWLATLFPGDVSRPFSRHHADFWDWMWPIGPDASAEDIECWSRAAGKTSTLELATVRLATQGRRYGLVISRTQQQADGKVENIAAKLGESPLFELFYPAHADRAVSKYGHSAGWRRSRLRTRGGFTLDGAGLDRALRGLKTEEERPDVIIIDEVDEHTDSALTIAKHEKRLSRSILPARGPGAIVLFMQNLVHEKGVMARLLSGEADYLRAARRVGPIPAIRDLVYEHTEDGYRVLGGEPTWPAGFDLARAEAELAASGPSAFLAEFQHEPQDIVGDVFGHLDLASFEVDRSDVPSLDRVVVWLDPAVEGDASSSQGVIAAGRSRNGTVYLLSGFEGRCGPQEALRIAVRFAAAEGSSTVGVETTQGGKVWESAFREAILAEGERAKALRFDWHKPARGKVVRMTDVLLLFEQGRIRIVRGTHHVIESGLKRFPAEPNDLVDSIWEAVRDLTETGGGAQWSDPNESIEGIRRR